MCGTSFDGWRMWIVRSPQSDTLLVRMCGLVGIGKNWQRGGLESSKCCSDILGVKLVGQKLHLAVIL